MDPHGAGQEVSAVVKVTMLLADAAQAVDGKLYILGGGWTITGPDPIPSAIALQIKVPWDRANRRHTFELTLLDGDGVLALLQPNPEAPPQPLQISGQFEVGRPAGVLPGTPLDAVVALSIGPLPLPPGGRYVWELKIDGRTEEDWHLPFSTRPASGPARLVS
jgi:hypothetical protein